MFERYNLEAQTILTQAESLAFSISSESITPVFLLLSFLRNEESELFKVAQKYEIDVDEIEKEIVAVDHSINLDIKDRFYMEYSTEMKKVSNDAISYSKKNKEKLVSTYSLAHSLITNIDEDYLLNHGFPARKVILKDLSSHYKRSQELDKIPDLHRMGEKELDPLIGREDVLEQLVLILRRRNKPNPILVGDPGVGKSFLIEHLARMIKNGEIKELQNKSIFELDLVSSVGGTKYRGEFEEKMRKILSKVADDGEAILFIDEIHNLVRVGAAEGAIDCANIIKPFLSRGDIQIIGATTRDEYERNFSLDKALKRRFQLINIKENTKEETLDILKGLAPIYSAHYQKEVDPKLLEDITIYAKRYLPNLFFPDKAIDILDNALASAKGDTLKNEDIKTAMETFYHIKVDEVFDSSSIIKRMGEEIRGQNRALSVLKNELDLIRLRETKDRKRPLGTYLFVGPSGVGKTLSAKLLAREYFKEDDAFFKIDLSAYKDPSSVSRLIGSSPGYVGYKDEATLLRQLKKRPRSLILLDEIEKAHTSILDIFLQAFEEGYFESTSGEIVDCTNAIFVLTGNFLYSNDEFSFKISKDDKSDQKRLEKELGRHFKYEFIARLDRIIIFERINSHVALELENRFLKEFNSKASPLEAIDLEYQKEIDKYGVRAIYKHAKESLLNSVS